MRLHYLGNDSITYTFGRLNRKKHCIGPCLQYHLKTFCLVKFCVLSSEYMKAQHILKVIGTFSKNYFVILMNSQESKEKVGHFILGATVI